MPLKRPQWISRESNSGGALLLLARRPGPPEKEVVEGEFVRPGEMPAIVEKMGEAAPVHSWDTQSLDLFDRTRKLTLLQADTTGTTFLGH